MKQFLFFVVGVSVVALHDEVFLPKSERQVNELIVQESSFEEHLPKVPRQQGFSRPDTLLEHALDTMSKVSAGSKAARQSKKLYNLLSSTPTHAQKLDNTVAQRSEITKIVDDIMGTLVSEYNLHKADALGAIATIASDQKIDDAQFRPLVAGARNWCTAWETQQMLRGTPSPPSAPAMRLLLGTHNKTLAQAKEEMEDATKALIPNSAAWQDAAASSQWSTISYTKGQDYSSVNFQASSAFQQMFNTARYSYWHKVKAYNEVKNNFNQKVQYNKLAGVVFRESIKILADFEVAQCKASPRQSNLDIVKGFNSANARRAAVYRSLEIIKCHAAHLHKEASKVKSDTKTCTDAVKSESEIRKKTFPDLQEPVITCPTVDEVRSSIRKLKPKLDFHYIGQPEHVLTDLDGNFLNNQGWVPSKDACSKVTAHAVQGQKCKDLACPNGKEKKAGISENYASSSKECCQDALETPNKFTAAFKDANGVKGGTYKFEFVPMPSETKCSNSATHTHRFLSTGDKTSDYLFKVCEAVGMKVLCDAGPGSVLDCSKNPKSVYIGTSTTPSGGYASNTYKFVNTPSQLHNAPSGSSSMNGVSKTSWFPSGWDAVQSKFDRANLCYFYDRNGGMCSLRTKSGNSFARGWEIACSKFMQGYTVTDDNQRVVCVKKM